MLCNIDASPIYLWVYKEHLDRNIISDSSVGLSLCVQGTCLKFLKLKISNRFIPVCTGNICLESAIHYQHPVYPCVYREHNICARQTRTSAGLSLCVQGTSVGELGCWKWIRFIPVCTGNIPIITYCFIIKILTTKFLPIF